MSHHSKHGWNLAAGKLDFKVDFYGIGMFPPAAYHSEGHQDGMGVCLYLALMKQILAEDFRFAVLDDVVMSVDGNHRRQFCQTAQGTPSRTCSSSSPPTTKSGHARCSLPA